MRRHSSDDIVFWLACLLCGLPVWLPHFPPMADLPQHGAQVAILLNLNDPDFSFALLFQRNLFTPYLSGYLLIATVTPLFGIVAASKLVISCALAFFALATRYLLRQTGADPYWAWLSFPVLYGFTYQWGLLNFIIAAPLGIAFLGLVWRHGQQDKPYSGLWVALLLWLLFFCHALILALFSVVAVFYWLTLPGGLRAFAKRAWPLAMLAPMVGLWLALTGKHPIAGAAIDWDLNWWNTTDGYYAYYANWADQSAPGWGRISGFFPRLFGLRSPVWALLAGVLLLALPLLAGCRPDRALRRWIALIVLVIVLLFLPSFLLGNVYTFQRFTFLALPFYLILLNPASEPVPALRRLAPWLAFAWIAFMSAHALRFNGETAGFETLLSRMEPGKRAVSLIFDRDDGRAIAPTLLHFPAWYSATGKGVVDPSFAENYAQPVNYAPGLAPKIKFQGFAWNPHWFNWQRHDGGKYDYFVVRAPVDPGPRLFGTAPCPVFLAAHQERWWLYRKVPGCQ